MKEFYKEKRVFITGHTGFKGAWLTRILLESGAEVCGYSLAPNTTPNLFDVLRLEKQIKHQIADIRNFNKLNDVVKAFKPDIIFHLAAQPLVRDSYDDPHYTYETNIMGTVNVLEAIRLNNIKAGVIITTDKVYLNAETGRAFAEDESLGGYDPYSNSKACADLIVNSYILSFFNPAKYKETHHSLVASVRAGNVIGGGDWAKDRLIPDLIKAIYEKQESLEVRSPDALRPWQHVLEPLSGYMLLGKHLYEGDISKVGAWNFGPEEEDAVPVKDILEKSLSLIQKGEYHIKPDEAKHEAGCLKLDITKAKKQLNWNPVLNINQAIELTMEWYKAYYKEPESIRALTLKQINSYFS